MSEQVLYEFQGVKVTGKAVTAGKRVHAVANIAWVEMSEKKPDRSHALFLLLVAVLIATFGIYKGVEGAVTIGGVLGAATLIAMAFQKSEHRVVVASAGGSSDVIVSKSIVNCADVFEAIKGAMAARS